MFCSLVVVGFLCFQGFSTNVYSTRAISTKIFGSDLVASTLITYSGDGWRVPCVAVGEGSSSEYSASSSNHSFLSCYFNSKKVVRWAGN
jgi:hypothetical protein